MNTIVMLATEAKDPITFGTLAGIALIVFVVLLGFSILLATLDDGWPFKKK